MFAAASTRSKNIEKNSFSKKNKSRFDVQKLHHNKQEFNKS